jgi:hypothetical protein
MSWSQQDNKQYRGKIDRILVSRTEAWEVDYTIDDYLRSRNYSLTSESRAAMHQWLDAYPGSIPVVRNDLYAWWDVHVKRK